MVDNKTVKDAVNSLVVSIVDGLNIRRMLDETDLNVLDEIDPLIGLHYAKEILGGKKIEETLVDKALSQEIAQTDIYTELAYVISVILIQIGRWKDYPEEINEEE